MEADFVFSPQLLDQVVALPGPNFVMRPLHIGDFEKGYTDLLAQLTSVGTVTKEAFEAQFRAIKAIPNTYFIIVVEDTAARRIVANGTVVLERKFTHSAGIVGHLEDIIVDSGYRGQQLGKIMINQLKATGEKLGVYKVILDCNDKNVEFYERCGFARKELQMAWYLKP